MRPVCSSCQGRCLQFLDAFESHGFRPGLTLIPLFNRLKQRYACRPTCGSRTEPVAIYWPVFAISDSPMGTLRGDRCFRRTPQSEPPISWMLLLLQQLKDFGWPAFS